MLRQLHNHIFALKLRDMFTQSPLVLVYQTLGQVSHFGVKQQLQSGLAQQLPDHNIKVDICHMKNTIAAATGDEALTRLFRNSNLLVGFRFPDIIPQQLAQQVEELVSDAQQQQQQQQQQVGTMQQVPATDQTQQLLRVKKGMSPSVIVGGLLERPMPGPHIPQSSLKALVELGTKLPVEQPLVLIGALYKRSNTHLADLKQWVKLDANQVGSCPPTAATHAAWQ
jgi:hypothetical protein